jgi:inner membrane protein
VGLWQLSVEVCKCSTDHAAWHTPGACGAFLLGYLSHLLADALTISGMPLLWPWRTRAYGLPKAVRLRTGGRVEYALTLLIVAAGLWG